MRIGVVIPSHNACQLLERCLRELFVSFSETGHTEKVVVVDNGSNDGSSDMVRDLFPSVRVISSAEPLGFARAVNLGIRELLVENTEVLLLLNSDAFLSAYALSALCEALRDPSIGIVGPQLVYPDNSWQSSFGVFPSPFQALGSCLGLDSVRRAYELARVCILSRWGVLAVRVPFVYGAAMCIRTRLLEEVGFFDESFYFYFEDADFCFRAQRAGWEVALVPSARVLHVGGGSSRALFPDMYHRRLFGAQELFVQKYYGRRGMMVYKYARALSVKLRVLFYSVLSKALLLLPCSTWKSQTECKIEKLNDALRILAS